MATSRRTGMGALAVVLLLAAPVVAQQQQPQRQLQQRQQPQAQQQQRPLQQRTARAEGEMGGLNDQQIATWLIMGNDIEAQISQFAAQRAHNPQVKQFAQTMAQEHANASKQLRQFAPNAPHIGQQAGQQRTGAREEHERGQQQQQQQPQQQQQQPQQQQQTGAQQQGQLGQRLQQAIAERRQDFLDVAHQIAERNLSSIEQELGKKEGAHFDMAYMGMQVAQHIGLINTTEVLRQHVTSPQLREILDKEVQSAQQHLQQARQIAHELEAEGGRGGQQQQQRTRQE